MIEAREFIELHRHPDCERCRGSPCMSDDRGGWRFTLDGTPYFMVLAGCTYRFYFWKPKDFVLEIEARFGRRLYNEACHRLPTNGVRPVIDGGTWNSIYYSLRDIVRVIPRAERPFCVGCGKRLRFWAAYTYKDLHSREPQVQPFCRRSRNRWENDGVPDKCWDLWCQRQKALEIEKRRESECIRTGRKLLQQANRFLKNQPLERPLVSKLRAAGIHTGSQFAGFMSALLGDLIAGLVSAQVGNAACNAGGKLLKVVEMQHRYGTPAGQKSRKVLDLVE